jgi:hypothetical protein
MKYTLTVILLLATAMLTAQINLAIEGQTYSNADDTWYGVNISRSQPTTLIFRNNSITSVNRYGYLLSAGDEVPGAYNNNLDGAVISGNVLTWNGNPEPGIIPHGIFTGYNIDVKIKYNYLNRVPMAIIRKSNGMTDVSGAVSYNILKDPGIGVVVKGMNGVKIYNNTFYSALTTLQTNRALIEIYENPSVTPAGSATGTRIFNNVFYSKNTIRNISITAACRPGFESDYNVFYCESGTPLFAVDGVIKTFIEWQALGYDRHSVVINPAFKDLINFVPTARLDYGVDLGEAWAEGLSVNAKWGKTSPETTMQNGKWQAGAVIHSETPSSVTPPPNSPPSISILSPTKSNAFTAPATVTIDATASDSDGSVVKVEFYNGTVKLGERTSTPWSFAWKNVSEGTYSITAAATDNSNARTVSAAVSVVVEKSATAINQLPAVAILTPANNDLYVIPAKIILTADASDADGSVAKVEYLVGGVKIGESYSPPFSFTFEGNTAGTFEITAIAYDNFNASTASAPVTFSLNRIVEYQDMANLYPSPNNGNFTFDIDPGIEISGEINLLVLSMTGNTVYSGLLSTGERSKNINMPDAVPGVYILKVAVDGRILTTKRFIKY